MSNAPVSLLWKNDYTVYPPILNDGFIPGIKSFQRKDFENGTEVIGRVSYSTIQKVEQENGIPVAVSQIKFFCGPEVDIKKGSYLIEIRDNRKSIFKCSGDPAIYSKHQEIVLERVSTEVI